MLIRSERHSADDLRCWEELHSADLAWAALPALDRRVARSLGALRTFIATGGGCYAGVSHGKDSAVLWHLLWRLGQEGAAVDLWHLRPTNHNPDCDLVRDELLRRWPMPYREKAVDYGQISLDLPDAVRDRLTDQRWYAAIREIDAGYGRHILGVRADESGGRRLRMRRWGESSPRACAPIGWWSEADVFAYLARHDLPVHPAYACLGATRDGIAAWPRHRLRVAELGDTHGRGGGRREWEERYYGQELNRNRVRDFQQNVTVASVTLFTPACQVSST